MACSGGARRSGCVFSRRPRAAASSGRSGHRLRGRARGDLGIIGHNGAGKSTLLRSSPGSPRRPAAGGPERAGRSPARGRHRLPPRADGPRERLPERCDPGWAGATSPQVRRDRRFRGLGRFIDTPVKRYSSGMYLRLAFSVAAHLEPEILIIDEVLSVGDLAFQESAWDGWRRSPARDGRCSS